MRLQDQKSHLLSGSTFRKVNQRLTIGNHPVLILFLVVPQQFQRFHDVFALLSKHLCYDMKRLEFRVKRCHQIV